MAVRRAVRGLNRVHSVDPDYDPFTPRVEEYRKIYAPFIKQRFGKYMRIKDGYFEQKELDGDYRKVLAIAVNDNVYKKLEMNREIGTVSNFWLRNTAPRRQRRERQEYDNFYLFDEKKRFSKKAFNGWVLRRMLTNKVPDWSAEEQA